MKTLAADTMQADWLKRAKNEAKIDGKPMLDEFLGYVRKYEKTATYILAERYLKCGKK
ncbi:MAG: hypothetical protein R3D67_21845 [Hyphomicrobiaceae bacterium]